MPASIQPAPRPRTDEDYSIIALDKFILATRDSGYKSTASAISELVDNAIQADASRIAVTIQSFGSEPNQDFEIAVLDNGCGMDPGTLRQALRFGGSSRFNDRRGLGRYGMGLPNSSLSQARRVTVYSWQGPARVYSVHLDVDDIARGVIKEVPQPREVDLPTGLCPSPSGTLVVWTRCDRLDNRRVSTLARKLSDALGQTFRFFLWGGTEILINGERVSPFDPLFLRRDSGEVTAELFGEPLEYEIQASPSDTLAVGKARVTFTQLPVHAWHNLSNEEKRELGIAKGAGVSIVRSGREVDFGWYFMGAKRRENYDDWFRCQIEFDPVLDEAFGITHTKQQIRPQQYLLDILTPDIEATAHALNGRIRKMHAALQAAERFAEAEQLAASRDHLLSPLSIKHAHDERLVRDLKKRHPMLRGLGSDDGTFHTLGYKIIEDENTSTSFFAHTLIGSHLVLVLNTAHPFYRRIYKPLSQSEDGRDRALRAQLELLLLAAARGEQGATSTAKRKLLEKHRKDWSDALATFLEG